MDYKVDQLLKCFDGIDIQTDFQFEISRSYSYHSSTVTYLRLETGEIGYFSFAEGKTDMTKLVFDGKQLVCVGGENYQESLCLS